jgi:hypothetical protein
MGGRRWFVAAVLALSAASGEARSDEVPDPRWLTDLGEARRVARESGKPIFAVFRCEY